MGVLNALGLRRSSQFERMTLIDHLISSPLTFVIIQLYSILTILRGQPFQPPRSKQPIKVVCISDTHDQTVEGPAGDILIHSGDLTNDGTVEDIQKQLDWLNRLPHSVKIVVCGNHDYYFDPHSRKPEDVQSAAKPDFGNIIYLEGKKTVQKINGRRVTIYGAPDIPECGSNFAYVCCTTHISIFVIC